MRTPARSARARTSLATCGHTAAGRSCPTPGSSTSRAPSIAAAVRLAAAGRSSGSRSGLVHRTVAGRRHVCRLEPGPLADAHAWLRFYERFWTERLDALGDLFQACAEPADEAEQKRPVFRCGFAGPDRAAGPCYAVRDPRSQGPRPRAASRPSS